MNYVRHLPSQMLRLPHRVSEANSVGRCLCQVELFRAPRATSPVQFLGELQSNLGSSASTVAVTRSKLTCTDARGVIEGSLAHKNAGGNQCLDFHQQNVDWGYDLEDSVPKAIRGNAKGAISKLFSYFL